MKQFAMRLQRPTSASPETVYDLLADISTHLAWGGKQQTRMFRLLSIDAPPGLATVGSTFTSTGTIPGSGARFADASTVTAAERPAVFEFTTHATVPDPRRPMTATYRHRYQVQPTPTGSLVSYELTQLEISNPTLRLALPGVPDLTWRMGIPMLAGRGFRNLLATAERKAPQAKTPATAHTIQTDR